jgi:hypothetical protein
MWLIHIVAPTNSEGCEVDINKAYMSMSTIEN